MAEGDVEAFLAEQEVKIRKDLDYLDDADLEEQVRRQLRDLREQYA